MEAKAIETIRDLAVAGAKIDLNTNTPTALIPSSFQIHSLEGYGAGRSRFRGVFTTTSLKDYAEHVMARKAQGTAKGFVNADNPESLSCTVFFNIGSESNPGHCDDTAVLSLKRTAAFDAVRQIVSQHHTQQALAEWLEDWRKFVVVRDNEDASLDLRKSINAVRNIKIETKQNTEHAVGNMATSRSAMEQIEAKSADTLPAYVVLTTPPYHGLQAREFVLALSVITGKDGSPTLGLRWMQKEAQLEEIAQEFKSVLAQEVGGAAALVLGNFKAGN